MLALYLREHLPLGSWLSTAGVSLSSVPLVLDHAGRSRLGSDSLLEMSVQEGHASHIIQDEL
jgi:hypothetical protein